MNNTFQIKLKKLLSEGNNEKIQSIIKSFYKKAPVYGWRFGLGPIIGRYLMIITQINHRTGNPCNVSLEYFAINGIKYCANLFGVQSNWYRNLLANPRVTIQTSDGTEQMVAIPITQDDEIITVVEWLLNRNPKFGNNFLAELGTQPTRKEILSRKEDFVFLRFDPTSEPTPHGLEVDLAWIWPLLLFWTIIFRPKRKK